MPLPPPGKTVWPPKSVEAAYKRYEVNSAWYGGDPEVLVNLYDGQTVPVVGDTRYRASQFRGGLVGAVSRWFWGTPPPAGELRAKLHLPIASDIARMSAALLFAEPPKITVPDKGTQDRLDLYLGKGGLRKALLQAAEVASPLGDVYLVGTWDTEFRDWPWLRPVHGDAVVPEWRWDMLVAATIWRQVPTDDHKVWRHLERHEPGRILHALYEGDSQHLGRLRELADHPDTERFKDQAETGIKKLTVVHVPNILPNRLERGSNFGMSDYSPGAIQLMDELDAEWSSLSREFRLAKARAVVSTDALRPLGPGQGVTVDADREFYSTLNIDPTKNPAVVSLLQPMIRVEEHLSSCRALVEQIIRSCGYSMATFGEGSEVAMTAEESRQRQSLSYLTRGLKTLYWPLPASLEMLLALDAAVFHTKVTVQEPEVEFGDQIAESTASTAQTISLLAQAGAASTEYLVRYRSPELDDAAVAEEVAKILKEKGLGEVPNPEDLVRRPGREQVALNGKPAGNEEDPDDVPGDGSVMRRRQGATSK